MEKIIDAVDATLVLHFPVLYFQPTHNAIM